MIDSAVVDIKNLTVRAGHKRLLSLDTLKVERGEMLGVLGPNGAGKSTLLRALIGFVACSGDVNVLGQAVNQLGGTGLRRLRCRIGYVPQLLVAGSEMPLTVREVVSIGRTGVVGIGRALGQHDRNLIDHWIEQLGLLQIADQRYTHCSGGEQRKTLIARAMVQQPELLLLDEPTANLDLAWREQVVMAIEKVHNETGVTVMLVCHELEVLPPGCDRVMIITNGSMIDIGAPADVLTDDMVLRLYGPRLELINRGSYFTLMPTAREVAP